MSKANRENGRPRRSNGERPRRQGQPTEEQFQLHCYLGGAEPAHRDVKPSELIMVCTGYPILAQPILSDERPAMLKVMSWLTDTDERIRKQAAAMFPDAVSMSANTVQLLARAATSDPSEEVRRVALDALEKIGLDAAEGLVMVLAALAQGQQCQQHEDVRTCSTFALEQIRELLSQFVNVPLARWRVAPRCSSARKKRGDDAPAKGVLALLNALVKWDGEPISRRKLPESPRLMEERRALGLPAEVSASTVGYQLELLASLCRESSILEMYNRRQCAQLRPGVKSKLLRLQGYLTRHILTGPSTDPLPMIQIRFDHEP